MTRYMTSYMNNEMTRLLTVIMLMMFSMGAFSTDVKIAYGGFFTGGTIFATQDDAKDGKVDVYLTVTPKKGYSISKKDITVVTTYLPTSSDDVRQTRADAPKISEPIDLGDDPKNLSAARTYKVTIDEDLGIWVQKATFSNGRKETGDVEVTYHIINLGRMNSDGTLGSDRSEALKFTIADNELGVPAKYKSPLAKNWKYYKADEVSFNSTTKVCTFDSAPSLTEGETLAETADVYVTYEMDEDAFGTVGLKDGGIYNIKQGNLFMYQSMYQNVNNLNAYFQSTNDPTGSIYLWKFNIKDPYQITIQTKSTSYDNYYLAGEANNFNNIRLKTTLAIAQSTKVWTFGLLPGGAAGTYRLVVADGYVPTANIQTLDEFNHGYLNNADKARYQRYQGSTYKNCDLTFPALKRSYTFHIVDRSQHQAIQYAVTNQEVGKLSDYTDIPEAIRSPYLEGETMTFYSFTGDYSPDKITDENLITEMPLTNNADIYVTYTNTHLSDKFLHLKGALALNVTVGGQYIYDDSGLKSESSNDNLSTNNRIWYFCGEDPYAVQIKNAETDNYLDYTTPSTLSVAADPANFILLAGSAEGDNSTYEQMELMAATGDANHYRIGYSNGNLNISTTAAGDASLQVRTYTFSFSANYYLIDKAGKLIEGPITSTSSELALPSEWVSPLVSQYHYYKTPGLSDGTYTPTDEVFNLIDAIEGGNSNIYVTYDVGTDIDITGGKTYLLKFSDGVEFHQEDGHDGINKEGYTDYGVTKPTKAIYPYNNGDFNLYVYGQEQWDKQLSDGSSTRTRWLWHIISRRNGTVLDDDDNSTPTRDDDIDPYHVVIMSEQNQKIKISDSEEYKGNTYLRTYKPNNDVGFVTSVTYENSGYSSSYHQTMPTPIVNGPITEYMILGTSLDNMILKTVNEFDGSRQIVDKFEQYWKNNPTARNILNTAGKSVGSQPVTYELSSDQKALLTAMGWHTYECWAYAAPWSNESTGGKTLANGNHWFQTISMGSGLFTLEEVSLVPQVILIDQHGWEIMRTPMYTDKNFTVVNTEGLSKFNSPMVKANGYHWYPKAVKTTGYHKYTISDPEPTIDLYHNAANPNNNNKVEWYCYDTKPYTSSSLAATPDGNLDGYAGQDKKYKTDFYVTYEVKPEYANAYTGAATADATIPTAYLLKQGGNYAIANGTTLNATNEEPANKEEAPANYLWYMKPNFDIDREMGYKYKGELGAQSEALTKTATDAANYNNGRNGFDPYNVQIQSKAQPLYYFTANTTSSALTGGEWLGSSDNVSLKNLNTKQTAIGYDQTTLNITNATFMVVDDGAGNMRLMPRFDQQKVMQDFATFEYQAVAQSAGDNGTHVQSFYLDRIALPKEIHSYADITEMNGHYLLAEDFTFDSNFESLENFTGIIDGQLHTIRGTLTKPIIISANGAVIKNVILENVDISTETNAGAICNEAKGFTRIYNCGVLDGSISGSAYVGGLVGLLDGTSRVINCYSYADITGGTDVGGIVGYNNQTTTAASINTMVMNCMFYGDITDGSTISPVYGGIIIKNLNSGGLNNFNYYAYDELKTKKITEGKYNCALAMEEKYLKRIEFYRLLLNSNKKLAAYYVSTTPDDMAKWVLETADKSIADPKPYPVLKAQGYYPSIINIDAENANLLTLENGRPKEEDRNIGGKLGTLSVTIKAPGDWTNAPSNAKLLDENGNEITTSRTITLDRTDKDEARFNFNYDKVQLPYYNDYGTKNYTGNKVVTGWKITDITEVSGDPYTSSNYNYEKVYSSEPSYFDYPNYNFADRKSSNKDLYSVSGRVFSQGAYFDVPYGVSSITIEPYWGNAAYVSDEYLDVVCKQGTTSGRNNYISQSVTQLDKHFSNGKITIDGSVQTVYTSISGALGTGTPLTGSTVYDNAIVLVGNLHQIGVPSGGDKAFTIMSVDLDKDNEPDNSLIFCSNDRNTLCPLRFDFLNIPGMAQAQKPNGTGILLNAAIFRTKGWFEITNTAMIYFTQYEYENTGVSNNQNMITKTNAPLILLGGYIDQFVSAQSAPLKGKTIYIHVGGNVLINSFGLGTHSDGSGVTQHVPVSVTGGDFNGFYLTGTYNQNAESVDDNAECYISGGRFGELAGAAQEQIGSTGSVSNGNIKWQIYEADITDFFGGGINDAKPVQGNITTDIFNSHATTFCGGPKFGNMASGKKVTTTAEGCVFDKYFGAGYGGNSYSRKKYYDNTDYASKWSTLNGYYYGTNGDRGKYYDGISTNCPNNANYGKRGPGVATDFDYEFFVWTSGATGVRFFVKFASFSLAQCNDVKSTLTGCTIKNNFYGGGQLGKVVGSVTSELNNCIVKGNVFGAGYSAAKPPILVRDQALTTNPSINSSSGMFEPGVPASPTANDLTGTTEFEWKQVAAFAGNGKKDIEEAEGQPKYVHTTVNLSNENLGSVAGNVILTIKGNSVIGTEGDTTTGHVFGGGEQSYVTQSKDNNNQPIANTGNTTVNLEGKTEVLGNVYGGGDQGVVQGSATVNIRPETPETPSPSRASGGSVEGTGEESGEGIGK